MDCPEVAELFGAVRDFLHGLIGDGRNERGAGADGIDFQLLKAAEDRFHCTGFVAEEETAAHAHEGPSEAFEHRLAFEVFLKFFRAVEAFAVALDGETGVVADHHEVDDVGTGLILRCDVETEFDQALAHAVFEVARAVFVAGAFLEITFP